MRRRAVLLAATATATAAPRIARAQAADEAIDLLRRGGVVLALRHADAPGNFDPPEFRIGDCRTQRNLGEAGRAQARHLGERLRRAGLRPRRVRSSPWCRCLDTARLAFGTAEAWDALGSPRGTPAADYPRHLDALRGALVEASAASTGFEVWVSHMFVLNDLVGTGTVSGEGLVLDVDGSGRPRLRARLGAP